MVLLVASKKDIAGMNIGKQCENLGLKVHYTDEDLLYIQNLPDSNFYIFLSKHKSESGKPCLTSHFPGNFSNAKFGGKPKELGFAFPSIQKDFMKNLNQINNFQKYQVVLEATHHGPTHFKKPVIFVEIGSTKKEWKDENVAKFIAESIKKTIQKNRRFQKNTIAFGGTHYPEKFTDLLLNKEFALGHIMPKYAIESLNEKIFKQMIEKSNEKIEYCIIDSKGCNRKREIIKMCKKNELKVMKI